MLGIVRKAPVMVKSYKRRHDVPEDQFQSVMSEFHGNKINKSEVGRKLGTSHTIIGKWYQDWLNNRSTKPPGRKKSRFDELTPSQTIRVDDPVSPPPPRLEPNVSPPYKMYSRKLENKVWVVPQCDNSSRIYNYKKTSLYKTKTYHSCYSCVKFGKAQKSWMHLAEPSEKVISISAHSKDCDEFCSTTHTMEKMLSLEITREVKHKVCIDGLNPSTTLSQAYPIIRQRAAKANLDVRGKFGVRTCFPPKHKMMRLLKKGEKKFYAVKVALKNPFRDDLGLLGTSTTGERLLLARSESHKIIVLGTDDNIRTLCESTVAVSDSTFDTAPIGGNYQAFTILGKFKEEWTPCIHAIMGTRTRESYDFVMNAVDNKRKDLGLEYKFSTFITDFEAAQMNCISKFIGEKKLRGCNFHQIKAMIQKCREFGLTELYADKESDCHKWIRRVITLPMLPYDCVHEIWNDVLKLQPVVNGWSNINTQKWIDYVQRQWMNKAPWRWNHFESGYDKTSNAAEAFHSALKRSTSGCIHPTIKRYLTWYRNEIHPRYQADVDSLIHDENRKPRPKSKLYVELFERTEGYKEGLEKDFQGLGDCIREDERKLKKRVKCVNFLDRTEKLMLDMNKSLTDTRKTQRLKDRRIENRENGLNLTEITRLEVENGRNDLKLVTKLREDIKLEPKLREDIKLEPKLREDIKLEPKLREDIKLEPKLREDVKLEPKLREDIKLEIKPRNTKLSLLSPMQLKCVENVWDPHVKDRLVLTRFEIEITLKDLQTLKGDTWLNDNIINMYFKLIEERSNMSENHYNVFTFNTYFWDQLIKQDLSYMTRWTKNVDLFSKEMILIPVHLVDENHWTFVIIDMQRKQIKYYDSLSSAHCNFIKRLWDFLEADLMEKKNLKLDFVGWHLEYVKDCPKQRNYKDCGVFVCKFAEFASRRAKMNFSQANMPFFRKQITYEIVSGRLMKHNDQ